MLVEEDEDEEEDDEEEEEVVVDVLLACSSLLSLWSSLLPLRLPSPAAAAPMTLGMDDGDMGLRRSVSWISAGRSGMAGC